MFGAAPASHGEAVYLVHEHEGGRVVPGHLEQHTHQLLALSPVSMSGCGDERGMNGDDDERGMNGDDNE